MLMVCLKSTASLISLLYVLVILQNLTIEVQVCAPVLRGTYYYKDYLFLSPSNLESPLCLAFALLQYIHLKNSVLQVKDTHHLQSLDQVSNFNFLISWLSFETLHYSSETQITFSLSFQFIPTSQMLQPHNGQLYLQQQIQAMKTFQTKNPIKFLTYFYVSQEPHLGDLKQ